MASIIPGESWAVDPHGRPEPVAAVAAWAEAIEAYRTYLLAIAANELGADLTAKLGASDLVQETFLAAHRDAATFRGKSPEEWRGWLRSILQNLAANARRHYRETAKRRVDREIRIDVADLEVADTATSPSARRPAASGPTPWPWPWPACRSITAMYSAGTIRRARPSSRSRRASGSPPRRSGNSGAGPWSGSAGRWGLTCEHQPGRHHPDR